ncbi:PREDICTED: uncharacterized protein LOC109582764 isoform X3 [Amphimedon queenslandica]|uniref:PARP catalytic domain-containing protein n=1 Tax=Amphimedon queenslandica TaxID=400682 RepID=A0A1X7UN93_AMPQE|nr:PREDICTED: uncharacterized protein LOC109582764 isoform X3 [Amphimedon queenslandica]|eukprot:XP_019853242.1 PREDICTED: uncharacterized protein LOC109582764 isoform X3 [Amphimedon queenslandica]
MDEMAAAEDWVEYIVESKQLEEDSPRPMRHGDVRVAWDDEKDSDDEVTDMTEPLHQLESPRIKRPDIPDEMLNVHCESGSPIVLHTLKPTFDDLKLLPDSSGSRLTQPEPVIKSPHQKNDLQVDSRGILRGSCSLCKNCTNFKRGSDHSKVLCVICGHPPAKHQNLGTGKRPPSPTRFPDPSVTPDPPPSLNVNRSSYVPSLSIPRYHDVTSSLFDITDERCVANFGEGATFKSMCAVNGCPNVTTFDENSGHSSQFCDEHQSRPLYVGQTVANQQSELISVVDDKCMNPNCFKQKWIDEYGQMYDFCGKTCRDKYKKQSSDIDPQLKCSNPSCFRPKWKEKDGRMHDFCGRSCRDAFNKQPPKPTGTPCLLPDCSQPCYVDPKTGTSETFCGQSHNDQAYKQILVELCATRDEYKKVATRFNKEWVKKPPPPTIEAIFQIFNKKNENAFDKYRQDISSSQEPHFHGTSLLCDVKANKTPCVNPKCGICGISRRGFDPALKGYNIPRFKRFGEGFYLAPNSSKCHDYTQGFVDYRAMLLCDVAPGNKHVVKNDQTKLMGPPTGHNSVYGASGGALNYDEIVLYKSEAINPKYIIFYKRDSIHKIAK